MTLYLDDNTGKYYIFDGTQFVEYKSETKPEIGSKGDTSFDDEEEKEHQAQVEKEREEDGETEEQAAAREKSRIEKAKAALQSDEFMKGIEQDNIKISQRERQRQKEFARKQAQQAGGKSSSQGIRAFEKDLETFMNNQVKEIEMNSWSKVNRRYVGSQFVMPGTRYEDNINKPTIGIYFDQSGSWDESDIRRGQDAIACLYELQKKNKIEMELKYFANIIGSTVAEAQSQGTGTHAGKLLIEDIKKMKYDNVIVMTDDDFDGLRDLDTAPNIKVKGGVWFLWRGNSVSKKLQSHLTGKRVRNYNI